jgi:hypothetical protein
MNCYSSHNYTQHSSASNNFGRIVVTYPTLLPKNLLLKIHNLKQRTKMKLKIPQKQLIHNTHTHTHTHTHIYIYIYIYLCGTTHTHTHIYIYLCVCCAFFGPDSKLYEMHGKYIKIKKITEFYFQYRSRNGHSPTSAVQLPVIYHYAAHYVTVTPTT